MSPAKQKAALVKFLKENQSNEYTFIDTDNCALCQFGKFLYKGNHFKISSPGLSIRLRDKEGNIIDESMPILDRSDEENAIVESKSFRELYEKLITISPELTIKT